MVFWRWCILLGVAALACTPALNGSCATDADCHAGESCNSAGLCLRSSAAFGDGDAGPSADAGAAADAGGAADAGDAGLPDASVSASATIDILSPTAGAIERGTFHVSAQSASALPIQDVTFYLTSSASGTALGQLVVTTPTVNTWSGDLTLNATSFGGGADLVAVIHRASLTAVTSSKVNVVVDQNAPSISPSWDAGQWWALDAGITLSAAVSDDRSGVASATLLLPDGGSFAGALATGTATFQLPAASVGTPGAAVHVPVSLGATDVAGNATLLAAASSLAVDSQPPTIALVALDPSVWRNGPLDLNANLSDGAGSGLGGTSLLLNKAFITGTPDGGGGYDYRVNLATLPATEAAVAFQVIGVDNVGNQADAGFSLNVDNVLPVISAVQLDSAFDGTDAANQGWFAGPTAAPSAAAIAVSAAVKDTNLVVSGNQRPAALVKGTFYYGSLNSTTNRWSFSIPRSVGLNATAPVVVSFDAQDLAGNHPAQAPSLSLQFDDVPASSFAPTVAADASWYARSGNVPVGVSFGAAPRSGFSQVLLKVTAQADVGCTSTSALSWSCLLPATYAAAGQETILGLSVAAKSITGLSATSSGSRRIDDAPPVVSNAGAVPYPAAGTWGHDGSHYTLRDSGTLYTFTAYDCGAGVSSVASFGFSPQLATRSASIADSGNRQACANGMSAVIYNLAVTGDLSSSTPGSFTGADNVVTLSLTAQDGVGIKTSSSTSFNATRRLWQTGAISAAGLALGPVLVVDTGAGGAVTGLSPATGLAAWGPVNGGVPIFSGPAVGGTAAAPVIYYGLKTASGKASIYSMAAGSGAANASCNASASVFGTCPGTGYSRDIQLLMLASDGTAAVIEDDEHSGITPAGADCGTEAYAGTRFGSGCSPWFPNVVGATGLSVGGNSATGAAMGRGGQVFIADRTVPKMVALTGSTLTAGSANTCSGAVTVTDNGGNDAPVCDGQRTTFLGGAFTSNWSSPTPFTGPLQNAGELVVATSGGAQPLALSTGASTGAALASQTAWAIDASSPPVVYLGNGATLSALRLSGGTFGAAAWGLPALPGTSITDVVMDKGGILYVASGGQVSAVITDSPGLGTSNNGWPIRGHDACRSYNLEYACPY